MAETEPVTTPEGETFSREYVEALQHKLDQKTKGEALLKAKFEAHETRQRAQLAEMQPVVAEYIQEGLAMAGEHKHELESLTDFGNNLAKVDNVESAMPLARLITCHSARFKRKTEEFSVTKDAAEALAKANKELDEVKAERDAKSARVSELEKLADERQVAAESLQAELAKAGVLKEKFDFSKASSREAEPAAETKGSVGSSTPAAPMVDPLLAFVSNSGPGSGRIGLSGTGHHVLGAGGNGDSSIYAALRNA